MLNKELNVISCARHSKLKKEYHHEGIQELLKKPLSKKVNKKKKLVQKEHAFKQMKEKTLDAYFKDSNNLPSRNSAIIEALKDGYTQGKVS